MIYLNFNLQLPSWFDRYQSIKFYNWKTPFKHKYIELQFTKNSNLLHFQFEFTVKQDHAGINLELGLLGYEVTFTFYDSRHWDYETNKWNNYEYTNC